jgi:protocatechuate 3,4-dioxygenase beta subunit
MMKKIGRRQAVRAFGLVGSATVIGCGHDSTTVTAPTSTTTTTSVGTSCVLIPQETDGPYPLYSALGDASLFRTDVREDRAGVPLTLRLAFVNVSQSCAPLTGAVVYIWHCDKDGVYSGYGSGTGATFLRGFQNTDATGTVTFTTIYPGWYQGRITHIHFEVFLQNQVTQGTAKATSQIAFPPAITQAVYASTLYAAHGQNTSVASFSQDNVFSDGTEFQLATVSGDVTSGYVATLTVGVAAS